MNRYLAGAVENNGLHGGWDIHGGVDETNRVDNSNKGLDIRRVTADSIALVYNSFSYFDYAMRLNSRQCVPPPPC